MKKIKVALIGAGSRGRTYTDLMDNEKFKVVAVAEPIAERRNYIRDKHGICEKMCFDTYETLLALPPLLMLPSLRPWISSIMHLFHKRKCTRRLS